MLLFFPFFKKENARKMKNKLFLDCSLCMTRLEGFFLTKCLRILMNILHSSKVLFFSLFMNKLGADEAKYFRGAREKKNTEQGNMPFPKRIWTLS